MSRKADGSGDGGTSSSSSKATTTAPPVITTMWCMGIRNDVSEQFVAPVREKLAALGVSVDRGPNSVFFSNARTDKGMAVRYLVRKGTLELSSALAFGDNPAGNDAPLTAFVNDGMPFISVSKTLEDTPRHLQNYFVGGQEAGTAECLEILCEEREKFLREQHQHQHQGAGHAEKEEGDGSDSENGARL